MSVSLDALLPIVEETAHIADGIVTDPKLATATAARLRNLGVPFRLLTDYFPGGPLNKVGTTLGAADGSTDCTQAINDALADLYATNGGTLSIPPGNYLILGQLTVPNLFAATPSAPYSADMPVQPTIRIIGAGGGPLTGNTTKQTAMRTTRLVMRWKNPAGDAGKGAAFNGGKLNSLGYGLLEIAHILFDTDQTADTGPFLFWTNTVVDLHHCSFRGNEAVRSTWAGNITKTALYLGQGGKMDALAIGAWPGTGYMAYDGTLASNFNGYGSKIRRCSFANVRRMMVVSGQADTIIVDGCNVNGGSNVDTPWAACIEFLDGGSVVSVRDTQIQSAGWNTGFHIGSGPQYIGGSNRLSGNAVWDPVAGNGIGLVDCGPAGLLTADSTGSQIVSNTYYPSNTYVCLDSSRQTTIAAPGMLASSTTLPVADATGITAGSLVGIVEYDGEYKPNDWNREWFVVSAVVGNTVTTVRASTSFHGAGTAVVVAENVLSGLSTAGLPVGSTSATVVGTNAGGALAAGAWCTIVDIDAYGKRIRGATETFVIASVTGTSGAYTVTFDRPTALPHGWPTSPSTRAVTAVLLLHETVKLGSEPTASLVTTTVGQQYGLGNTGSPGSRVLPLVTLTKGDGTTIKPGDPICLQPVVTSTGIQGTNRATQVTSTYGSDWATVETVDTTNLTVTLSRVPMSNHNAATTAVLVGPFTYAVTTTKPHKAGSQIRHASISPPRHYPRAAECGYHYRVSGGTADELFQVLGIESRYGNATTITSAAAIGATSIAVADVAGITPSSFLRLADLTKTTAPGGQGYGVGQENAYVAASYATTSTVASAASTTVFTVAAGQGSRFAPGQQIAVITLGVLRRATIAAGGVSGDTITLTAALAKQPLASDVVTPTGAASVPLTEALFYGYPSGAQLLPGPYILQTTPFIEQRSGAVATGQQLAGVIDPPSAGSVITHGGVAPSAWYDLGGGNEITTAFAAASTVPGYLAGKLGLATRAWGHRPSDADYYQNLAQGPIDGLLGLDNTSGTLYTRTRGLWKPAANASGVSVAMTGDPNAPTTPALLATSAASTQPALALTGSASQTANVLETRSAVGTATAAVASDGSISSTRGITSAQRVTGVALAALNTSAATPYITAVTALGPFAYLRLDDVGGVATDTMSHLTASYQGTLATTAPASPPVAIYQSQAGITADSDTAAYFPGLSASYVSLGSLTAYVSANAAFSIVLLCKPDNFLLAGQSNSTIVGTYTAASGTRIQYSPAVSSTNPQRFTISPGGADAPNLFVSANTYPALGTYHVVYTWDGTTEALYVNGVLDSTRIPPATLPNLNRTSATLGAWAGGYPGPNYAPYRGLLDDVALWARALSPTEVSQLYTALGTYVPTTLLGMAANAGYTGDVLTATVGGTQTHRALPSGDFQIAGASTARSYGPSGLAGATAATRYVGGTASGAPMSGTFLTGDVVFGRDGSLWVCTAGGSPGTWAQVGAGGGGGGGTVTSVGLSAPGELTVGGSPVTAAGTLALAWATQAAGLVMAGPASGGAATPGYRAIASTDITSALAASTVPAAWLGTSGTTAAAGNDGRLSDARTPVAHAGSHQVGGSDVLSIASSLLTGTIPAAWLGASGTTATAGNDSRLSDSRTPTAHASTHAAAGSDPISVVASQLPGAPPGIWLGTTASKAAAGNDARLSDARTPLTHGSTHAPGAADSLYADHGNALRNALDVLPHGRYFGMDASLTFNAGQLYFLFVTPDVGRSITQMLVGLSAAASGLSYLEASLWAVGPSGDGSDASLAMLRRSGDLSATALTVQTAAGANTTTNTGMTATGLYSLPLGLDASGTAAGAYALAAGTRYAVGLVANASTTIPKFAGHQTVAGGGGQASWSTATIGGVANLMFPPIAKTSAGGYTAAAPIPTSFTAATGAGSNLLFWAALG